jgi:hypothetical protein
MVDKQYMIKYLEAKGWIIKNGAAYLPEDKECKIPYSIEGTYKLYIKGIFK